MNPKERILQISKQESLSHLGSNLSAVDAIEAVYRVKKDDEKFVLSNGHAGLALYVILEKYKKKDALDLYHRHGVHPEKNKNDEISVSTGSLGMGLPIAVGMALARRDRNIYCMISDGECAEGSIWEALRVGGEQNLTNLKVICNANGWAAYKEVDRIALIHRFAAFGWTPFEVDGHNQEEMMGVLQTKYDRPSILVAHTTVEHHPELSGLGAHYKVLK